jgi:hypothetical protein
MLNSFYLFLIPLVVAAFYLFYKYFVNKKKIENVTNNAFLDENVNNNLEEAKNLVFDFIDDFKNSSMRTVVAVFHWVLHFIVLFLKFISDITDIMYSTVRDFFLKTATKEKGTVSLFWKHLKEYKKEKEQEQEDNK